MSCLMVVELEALIFDGAAIEYREYPSCESSRMRIRVRTQWGIRQYCLLKTRHSNSTVLSSYEVNYDDDVD